VSTFSKVWAGQVFSFESKTGPWIKTGKRTYVRYDIGSNAFYGEHQVGSINVKVTEIKDPPSYFWVAFNRMGNSINYGEGYKPFAKVQSTSDPLMSSGILGDVVQMFSGAGPISPARYVTVYARGAQRYQGMSDIGIPLGTYDGKSGPGGKWRRKIFSPQHGLM
jgi:hypothetical protein